MAILLGFFYAQSQAEVTDQPRPVATYTIPFSGVTAKTAYQEAALSTAQQWQSDVQMVAISSDWADATWQSVGQAEVWDFRFYSPERRRTYFVVVPAEQPAVGRAHLYKLSDSPATIEVAEWLIDSDEALSIWVNNGGGVFMETFPDNKVEALLHQDPDRERLLWDIIGVSADQSQLFFLTIDASTGQVLN